MNDEPTGVGHLPQHAGLDFPFSGDGEEIIELFRPNNRHHAFLAFRHQNLFSGEGVIPEQDVIERDLHPAVTVCRQLRCRAADPGCSQVLDALDDTVLEKLETAFDQYLLRKGVTDLDRGALRRTTLIKGFAGEYRGPADSIAPGSGPEENYFVAGTLRVGEVQVLVAENPDGQRVHQGVVLVHRVKPGLTTDVGQTEAIAIKTDSTHHTGRDSLRVGVIERSKAKSIHDRNRPGTHGDNVADNSPDPGCRALKGLNKARVVVAFDLEGDRPALTDIDDARVFSHADHEVRAHLVGHFLAKLAQVNFGGFVGAMLTPHH